MKIIKKKKSFLKSSYFVAFQIAKTKKKSSSLVPQVTQKLKQIPLSDSTVQRRIGELTSDVVQQVIEHVKNHDSSLFNLMSQLASACCCNFPQLRKI